MTIVQDTQSITADGGASRWKDLSVELVPLLAERADDADSTGEFVAAQMQLLRERRMMSMLVPAELGGGGATYAQACTVLRELAHGCPATSLTFAMHTHLVAAQVWRHHHDLPAPVLPKVAASELMLVSTGAKDWIDSSGSAVAVDGGFRVSGSKSPSSGAPAGDVLITSIRWEPSPGQHSTGHDVPEGPQVLHLSVPFSAEGVRIEPTWDSVGMRATGSDTVVLDDVFVPEAAVSLVRPAGVWHPVWNVVLGAAMPLIMSTYVGVAEEAVRRAMALTRPGDERRTTATAVARMRRSLRTAQDAVDAMVAASDDLRFDNDLEIATSTLERKVVAAEACVETVRLALEVGGAGYASSSGLGRLFRDVLGSAYHPLPVAAQEQFCGRVALGLEPI